MTTYCITYSDGRQMFVDCDDSIGVIGTTFPATCDIQPVSTAVESDIAIVSDEPSIPPRKKRGG